MLHDKRHQARIYNSLYLLLIARSHIWQEP